MICLPRLRILVKDSLNVACNTHMVPWDVILTGTQPSASMVTPPNVSFYQTPILLNPPSLIAPTRYANQKMQIDLSAAQPSAQIFLTNKCARLLITPTMVTSQKLLISFSLTPLQSLESRKPTSSNQEKEPLSSSYSKASATVTKSANSTPCTTRPKKFACQTTIGSAHVLSWPQFRCSTTSSEDHKRINNPRFIMKRRPAHPRRRWDKQKTK